MIVGVDMSLTGTGVAMLDDGTMTTTRVESTGHTNDSLNKRFERQTILTDRVLELCRGADFVVIETLFTAKNAGALIDRAGLWWRIIGSLTMWSIPVVPVTGSQGKKFLTGSGNADKGTMVRWAGKLWPEWVPSSKSKIEDEADAIALASIGLALAVEYGQDLPLSEEQCLFEMPEYRREVIEKLDTVWKEAWA